MMDYPEERRLSALKIVADTIKISDPKELVDCANYVENYIRYGISGKKVIFEPYPHQKLIHRSAESSKSLTIHAARQIGLTTSLCDYASIYMQKNPETHTLYFTNNQSTLQTVYERLEKSNPNSQTKTCRKITLTNNSTIEFSTFQNAQSVLCGNTVNMAIIDNAAFIPYSSAFPYSLMPAISSTNGKIIAASSGPIGEGWFAQVHNSDLYNHLVLPWFLHPNFDFDWRDKIILQIGEDQFNKEYGCK